MLLEECLFRAGSGNIPYTWVPVFTCIHRGYIYTLTHALNRLQEILTPKRDRWMKKYILNIFYSVSALYGSVWTSTVATGDKDYSYPYPKQYQERVLIYGDPFFDGGQCPSTDKMLETFLDIVTIVVNDRLVSVTLFQALIASCIHVRAQINKTTPLYA